MTAIYSCVMKRKGLLMLFIRFLKQKRWQILSTGGNNPLTDSSITSSRLDNINKKFNGPMQSLAANLWVRAHEARSSVEFKAAIAAIEGM